MALVLGIIIGLAIGALAVYMLQQGAVKEQAAAVQERDRRLATLEAEHEQRLRDATTQLQRDYQHQAEQDQLKLRQEYETKLQAQVQPSPTLAETLRQTYEQRIQQLEAQLTAAQTPSPSPAPPTAAASSPAAEPVAIAPPIEPPSAPTSAAPPVTDAAAIEATDEPAVKVVQPLEGIPAQSSSSATMEMAIAMEDAGIDTIPNLLEYVTHPDGFVRQRVAKNLGALSAGKSHRYTPDVVRALQLLSRDELPKVRQTAVAALGDMQSARAIPILRQALRDPDLDVVAAASVAIAKFKGYNRPKASKTANKKSSKRSG